MVAGSGPPPNSCFALRASQVFDFSERRSRPDTTIRGLLGQRSRTACAEMVWRWSPSEDKEHLGRGLQRTRGAGRRVRGWARLSRVAFDLDPVHLLRIEAQMAGDARAVGERVEIGPRHVFYGAVADPR